MNTQEDAQTTLILSSNDDMMEENTPCIFKLICFYLMSGILRSF